MKDTLRSITPLANAFRIVRNKFAAARSRRLASAYLAAQPVRCLHLGCGSNLLTGWFNTDRFAIATGVAYLDVSQPFPFPDGSVHVILAEHMIEHIPLRLARVMVAECVRVLAPGGILRISTPDLNRYLQLYTKPDTPGAAEMVRTITDNWIASGFYAAKDYLPPPGVHDPAFVINDLFRNYEHQFIFDRRTLERLLRDAGFDIIDEYEAGVSDEPRLQAIETHTDPVNRKLTLVLEARIAPSVTCVES